MKKPHFADGEIYHVYNRGVEKREIYLDEKDFFRFVHCLYEFNDERPVTNTHYFFNPKTMVVDSRPLKTYQQPRELLVDILVFTLMPNHFHLMLRQRKEKGIVKFMQKLGTGYSMYFNKRYERVGSLFQGRFKAAHVNVESHFIHLPHYIHTNPLSLEYRGSTSIEFLSTYRWSSFPDYIGKKNFPSITHRDFLLDIFGGENAYKSYTQERLYNQEDQNYLNAVDGLILEKYRG
jgi:putative transposase